MLATQNYIHILPLFGTVVSLIAESKIFLKKYFFFFAIVHLSLSNSTCCFPPNIFTLFKLLLSPPRNDWTILTDPIPSHLSSEEQRYWQEYGKLDEGCSLSWWRSWARQCFLLFFPSTIYNPSPRGPLYQTKIITLLDQNQTKQTLYSLYSKNLSCL